MRDLLGTFLVGLIGLGLVILATPASASVGGAWGLALGILMVVLGLIVVHLIQ